MAKMLQISMIIFVFVCEMTTVSSWGYVGNKGPAYWGQTYPNCLKKRQSPIEITVQNSEYTSMFKNFEFSNYNSIPANSKLFLLNDGHTVMLGMNETANMMVRAFGQTFKPLQIHFHWGQNNSDGSEHRARTSNHHPAEMHFVHINTKYSNASEALKNYDGLLVFGTIIEISPLGRNNTLMAKFTDHFHKIMFKSQSTVIPNFPLSDLFHVDSTKYFHYNGSLTTPACNEAVLWVVFKEFLYISQAQMDEFRKLRQETVGEAANKTEYLSNNYRPLQPRNGRKIYRTFSPVGAANAVYPSILTLATIIILMFVNMDV